MLRTAVVLAVLMMLESAGFAQDLPKQDLPKQDLPKQESPKQGLPKTEPFIIGDATMMEDGTIVVNLRRTRDGMNVSGIVKYPVDSPHYRLVLDHLGGMRPGDTRLVPAWDDPVPEKK